MILFLHNRYRTTGGEERTVADLRWLVREHLHEHAELLQRDSAALSRSRAAAGLLRGGLQPADVASAVRLGGARVVHAHNLHPAFGYRALAAARAAGARVVLHLHQYRLVCAVGVCFTRGQECTRCHARNTLPGLRLNCRANLPEATAYAAALSLWQRRLVAQAHAVVVPSAFAAQRLRQLGAPLPWDRLHVLPPPLPALDRPAPPAWAPALGAGSPPAAGAPHALLVGRLAPEKGVDVAIAACRLARLPLLIAGDGPERASLERLAAHPGVRFLGRVHDAELARLRAGASIALVPSRSAETFAIAAAEAMAAGLPVAGSRVGALPELLDPDALAPPGDPPALAEAIARVLADPTAPRRALQRVREICAPELVARRLRAIYDAAAHA
ncbi:MAG TPA: glycosyltransferase family 4 protein [Solirubrobacteraceae bacterium]|nr:glycosyltransferase family 4 protein [Solirubrobacteraceae bacterium]